MFFGGGGLLCVGGCGVWWLMEFCDVGGMGGDGVVLLRDFGGVCCSGGFGGFCGVCCFCVVGFCGIVVGWVRDFFGGVWCFVWFDEVLLYGFLVGGGLFWGWVGWGWVLFVVWGWGLVG